MVRGQGSLFFATRKGVHVLGLPLLAATTPAANWWAHHGACAWTAAWLDLRGRRYLGPRELLDRPEWSGSLDWLDSHSFKHSGHRPDLIGFRRDLRIAIEVELAAKSRPRLDAILKLHWSWAVSGKTHGVIYICGDRQGARRIEQASGRIGLSGRDGLLRIELLDTIKEQAVAADLEQRRGQPASAQASA